MFLLQYFYFKPQFEQFKSSSLSTGGPRAGASIKPCLPSIQDGWDQEQHNDPRTKVCAYRGPHEINQRLDEFFHCDLPQRTDVNCFMNSQQVS